MLNLDNEQFVCSGCPAGWCQGCAPDTFEMGDLDLPNAFESGTCKCGQFVRAGNLWEHQLVCEQARDL